MKKALKIILIILGVLFILLLSAEWLVEIRLQSMINTKPDRKYNIVYSDLDLNTLLDGFTLDEMQMIPMDLADSGKTKILGKMDYAELSGFSWIEFLFSKKAEVNSMRFIKPDFTIYISPDTTETENTDSGKNFQELFVDILARVELHNFELLDGKASVVVIQDDSLVVGEVDRISIVAKGLQTDSVQMNNLVPFKLESINTELEGIRSNPDNNTTIEVGTIQFDHTNSFLEISDISMKFTKDWTEVSQDLGKQIDLIQFDLQKLEIHDLDAKSSLYGSLDIEASMIRIDSLILADSRDKNKPRPPDAIKPMFTGMVNQIPFPLNVDSIVVEHSSISYTELPEGKTEAGTLTFADINGSIYNISNLPQMQEMYENLTAKVSSKLNGQAPLTLELTVPYSHDGFIADATITGMEAISLNVTTVPLASVGIESGRVDRFNLVMNANETTSNNTLTFDYHDLEIAVLTPGEDNKKKKAGLLSGVAKSAIKHKNQPGEKNYVRPQYTSERNIYRSPFNFMWSTIKSGMIVIVPSNTAVILLPKKEKQERKEGTKNK